MSLDLGATLDRLAPVAAGLALIDTGTITRDADLDAGSTVDYTTLAITDSTPGTVTYTGKCAVIPAAVTTEHLTATAVETPPGLRGLLPKDTDVKAGDILTLSVSRDPALVGLPLRVTSVELATFAVLTQIRLEKATPTWP